MARASRARRDVVPAGDISVSNPKARNDHFRNLRIREWPSTQPPADEVASLDVGFKALYTGLDLAGWNAGPQHPATWRPRDWILDCNGQGVDTLRTAAAWGDVDFIVDWRMAGGGSAGLLPRGMGSHEIRLESDSDRWTRTRLTLRGQRLTVTHGEALPEDRDTGLPSRTRVRSACGTMVDPCNSPTFTSGQAFESYSFAD